MKDESYQKIFLIAGETSGDLHGSNLIAAIKKLEPTTQIFGIGGPKMKEEGQAQSLDIEQFKIMGFVEVLLKLFTIIKQIKFTQSEIVRIQPDKVVLIDYGGFNLRIAKFCKAKGIPVHYYILPKVWAWNEKRVFKIQKNIDKAYVIFPFEEDYFKQFGIDAKYLGNPVRDELNKKISSLSIDKEESKQKYIALLPGSRNQEIKRMLPVMLEVARRNQEMQFKLALVDDLALKDLHLPNNVTPFIDKTYQVLINARAALITSGTANVEAALLNIPQVVCYKANRLSYFIGKRVVKIKYISPVNLILDRKLVTELIQNDLNAVLLEKELMKILAGDSRQNILEGYQELSTLLGDEPTSFRVAKNILHNNT